MKQGTKWGLICALIIALCLGAFCLGRRSVNVPEPEFRTDTLWVDLPPVHDTLRVPVPAEVVPPDTVYYPVPEPTDTAALFAVWLDYYSTREYELDFSSDSTGVFKVGAKVTQNKLQEATSTIQPRVKVVTNTETYYKIKPFQPWVMVSSSTDFKFQQLQVGVDLNGKWMLGVGGIRYDKSGAITISAGYKF